MPSCAEYRLEMTLVSLINKLEKQSLDNKEREDIEKEIRKIKEKMNMD